MNIHLLATYTLLAINVFTFFLFGIDKMKARLYWWRVPESILFTFAALGGSVGAWLGMKVWHHKTLHKKFIYGIPLIFLLQVLLMSYLHARLF